MLVSLLAASPAIAQNCKVLDPELQRTHSGPCVDGLAEGEGSASGSAEYRGGFKAGRKHGKGVKTWPNGDRYEGEFVEDRREGAGAYTWGRGPWEGERYEGGYRDDKRHGHGTYRWPSGDVYSGPWEDDRVSGVGTEMMRARAKYAAEARAAVAREGQKVCREMPVGIGGRDWVRGVVVAIEVDHVGVRIDDPGAHAHFPRGEVVWDLARSWTPCW
ncbi:MAG: MORN repeat-containing protein [Burkholderiales bacterium]